MPLEAGIAQAVKLALALKHPRSLLQVPDLVSQAIALPEHPSACARADASGQLQELPFCPFQAESQCAEHFSAQVQVGAGVFCPSAGFRPVGAQAPFSGLPLQGCTG